jgi:EpsD family peptidyl-prolyl cis-trans isomerase
MAALAAGAVACTQGSSSPVGKSSSPLVVSVNGVALTEADVQLALKPVSHGGEASTAERRKAVIAGLVREELARQKALELGLEPEGAAADEVGRLEVALNAARRHALAEAYFTKQVLKKAEPTEQEARQYFEANAAMLKTEFGLQQIFVRDEAAITQAQAELAKGTPFEEVARRQYPGLPEGVGLPWELGFLSWKQLPEPWRAVLQTMQPGQVSPVLKGPGGRFWIIKLLERRPRPEVSFEELKPLIVEDLKRSRLEQLTQQSEQELRKSARIVEP